MEKIDELLEGIINSKHYSDKLNLIYSSRKNIFPKQEDVFRAFKLSPLSKTKVVIFGQDPYYKKGVADGLAFSTRNSKTPSSLINIFKEIKSEYKNSIFETNDLSCWAKQGVLLLNTCLTVEENNPLVDKDLWKELIYCVIDLFNQYRFNVIFVLWGSHARHLKKFIDIKKHYVLESAHPSPLSSTRGFFGNNHFQRINEILIAIKLEPINWNTYNLENKEIVK